MTLPLDTVLCGDSLEVLKTLPDESVHCCVTSPPYYGLRDYGMDAQIGREATPEEYIARLTAVFREVRRVLRSDGTLWVNIADSYCGTSSKGDTRDPKYPQGLGGQSVSISRTVRGCKQKDLIGIPWMLAFSLRGDGWYLRNDVIWAKNNPMPESAKDRCTRSHEHIFLLTKSRMYYFDWQAIAEPIAPSTALRKKAGRGAGKYAVPIPGQPQVQNINKPRAKGSITDEMISPVRSKRDVWIINTVPYKGGHFAAYPPKLAETCIMAGCPAGGIVLDPFMGSGTTGLVAKQNGRRYIGIELNTTFCTLARERIGGDDT